MVSWIVNSRESLGSDQQKRCVHIKLPSFPVPVNLVLPSMWYLLKINLVRRIYTWYSTAYLIYQWNSWKSILPTGTHPWFNRKNMTREALNRKTWLCGTYGLMDLPNSSNKRATSSIKINNRTLSALQLLPQNRISVILANKASFQQQLSAYNILR